MELNTSSEGEAPLRRGGRPRLSDKSLGRTGKRASVGPEGQINSSVAVEAGAGVSTRTGETFNEEAKRLRDLPATSM